MDPLDGLLDDPSILHTVMSDKIIVKRSKDENTECYKILALYSSSLTSVILFREQRHLSMMMDVSRGQHNAVMVLPS